MKESPSAADIFDRHHVAVFRFLRRMTGSREEAEDLAQEVFLRVMRGLGSYLDQGRERAWVFRIARNVFLDRARAGGRTPPTEAVGDVIGPPIREPATRLMLDQALGRLSDSDRQAFLMRELAGLGYAEIAAALGLTSDAARNRIHRARMALRRDLGRGEVVASMRQRSSRHD